MLAYANEVDANANEVDANANEPTKRVKRDKNKNKEHHTVEPSIIHMPNYENYNSFLVHNFTGIQLKQICKYFKLNVTGTKKVLTNIIYKHLFLSYNAAIIQNFWRKNSVKRYARLHGPAQFKRSLCVNETDFFTMDDIKDIPYTQFFSYKDSDNMIYGFDIMSLYNLITKKEDNDVLNPYTRNPLSRKIKRDFKSLIYLSNFFKENVQLDMAKTEISKENVYNNEHVDIDHRAMTLFHEIDSLGHYTNPTWFIELRRHQLLRYMRELFDIWTYRAQLLDQIKYEICPNGSPFNTVQINELAGLALRDLQNTTINLMEIMCKSGISQNSRYLGSTYVLCALTLVSDDAALALPWLYESVVVHV